MAAKKRKRAKIEFWNPRIQEKLRSNRRGTGILERYIPWLQVQDFSSNGICARVKGWRTGRRDIHLFSNYELYHFYTLEWDNSIFDYREQFPLEIAITKSICDRRGIKHPGDGPNDDPIVMTTDVRITHQRSDGTKFDVCHSIKPAGFYRLQFTDILDYDGLIAKFRQGGNFHRFCGWLFDSFTPQTQQKILSYAGQEDPCLIQSIVRELNGLLSGKIIYSDELFKGIRLEDSIYQEVLTNPQSDGILRVNRLLLKAAFPFEFTSRPPLEELTDQAKAKIKVEEEYWSSAEGTDIRFEVITGSEIDWVLARNVEEIHPYRSLMFHGIDDDKATHVGEFMWKAILKGNRPLYEIAELTDYDLKLKSGTALAVAKNRIATKTWGVDLHQPFLPYKQLALLTSDAT
jgi:hypothetical protein